MTVTTLLAAVISIIVTVKTAQQGLTTQSDTVVKCVSAKDVTINASTGVAENVLKTLNQKRECVDDLIGMNAACSTAPCSAVDPVNNLNCMVPPHQTWDEYNAELGRCVKSLHPSCEQQLCDAAYCSSPSVLDLLPTQHKITAFNGQCINPGETTVAAACNNLDNHTWLFPACLTTTPDPVITAEVTSATTSRLKGTLGYPRDATSTVAATPELFTYTLSNPLKAVSGNVVLGSANINCSDGLVCFDFEIYFGSQHMLPGTYKFSLQAKPTWVQDTGLFSKVSVAPLSLNVVQNVDDSEYASMNPDPQASVVIAQQYYDDPEWMLKWLNRLKQLNPTLFVAGQLPRSFSLIPLNPHNTPRAPYFALLAPPEICPLEHNSLLSSQIIILGWNNVALPDSLGPSENTDFKVRYSVTKNRQGLVGSSVTLLSAGVEDKSLNVYPVVADCIQVGDVWNYTIQAFVTSATNNWDYGNTRYKSEPVVVSVVGASFSEEVCHAVSKPAGAAQLPPWMWATPQGCVWYPNNQAAADYYCAVEYNQTRPGFNPDAIYLSTASNKCEPLGKSYPKVTQEWSSSSSCNSVNSNNHDAVCFTGDSSEPPRAATCKYALPLGSSADTVDNVSAFSQRMNNIVNFHNVHAAANVDLTSISATPEQQALYMTNYFKCGPSTSADTWGSGTPAECDALDFACQRLSLTAGCDTNVCGKWESAVPTSASDSISQTEQKYLQHRTCFVDKEVGQTECCPAGATFNFDRSRFPAGMCVAAPSL